MRADVAVQGERIVEMGELRRRADRVIDAEGALVTPGFVDIHTHLDAQMAWDPVGNVAVLARRHPGGDGQLRRDVRPVQARGSPAPRAR